MIRAVCSGLVSEGGDCQMKTAQLIGPGASVMCVQCLHAGQYVCACRDIVFLSGSDSSVMFLQTSF